MLALRFMTDDTCINHQ